MSSLAISSKYGNLEIALFLMDYLDFSFSNSENLIENVLTYFYALSLNLNFKEKEKGIFLEKLLSKISNEKEAQTPIQVSLQWFLLVQLNTEQSIKKAEELFSKTNPEIPGEYIYDKRYSISLNPEIYYLIGMYYSLHHNFLRTDLYLRAAYDRNEFFIERMKSDKSYEWYKHNSINQKKGIVYKIEEEKKRPKLLIQSGHTSSVNYIAYSPDGSTIATASSDNTARIWTSDGKLLHELKGHTANLVQIEYSPDGVTLATASMDGTAKIWSVDGKLLFNLKGHNVPLGYIKYSPNGKTLITAPFILTENDYAARIWSNDGRLLHELKGHTLWISNVTYSPDGKTIATASWDKTARIWSNDGKLLHELTGTGGVTDIRYSPDGKNLVTVSDKKVKIWSTDGILLHELIGHSEHISHIAYSSDGMTLATASEDGTFRIWNNEGNLLHEIKGHAGRINQIFSRWK
jgi:dipeptidyl aminopeptidase/acylaminoacyl peptidase